MLKFRDKAQAADRSVVLNSSCDSKVFFINTATIAFL